MAGLIPLNCIPYRARAAEARERAKWPNRAMALDAASIKIVAAPGCYGGAFPPVRGWVLTRAAAEAISATRTTMPGGATHRRNAYVEVAASSDALGEYLEAIARGAPADVALAAYEAARTATARA